LAAPKADPADNEGTEQSRRNPMTSETQSPCARCRHAETGTLPTSHLYKDIDDISLVSSRNQGLCKPFELHYLRNESDDDFLKLCKSHEPIIGYNEKNRDSYDLLQLLNDPYRFLHKPPPGKPTLLETYGEDVLHAITFHIYRLVTEDINPLYRYRDPENATRGMIKDNKTSRASIKQVLERL
jgi:hypothetical protein